MSNTAGAVIAAKRMHAERAMIEALRAAEAFAADRAIPLAPDSNLARLALRGLLRQNAIRQGAPGHYYLDEPVYAGIRKARQRMLIGVAVIAVVFVALVGLLFSGVSPDGKLPEIVERTDHPWFIGVQFHPELKSKPFEPHPLFTSFIAAAMEQSRLV